MKDTGQQVILGGVMERLEAFEKMLSDIREQSGYETAQMDRLKAAGKEKSLRRQRQNMESCWRNRILFCHRVKRHGKSHWQDKRISQTR